jgi:hypothetical protein
MASFFIEMGQGILAPELEHSGRDHVEDLSLRL